MTKLAWDQTGERTYETGVDRGVLYIPVGGVYTDGYTWNGLTAVTESPTGAEATPIYADNIKYLNLVSAEEFAATIEAYTFPDEFMQCDGTASPEAGVTIGQQSRKIFGFSYRTKKGNDTEGDDYGYKIHMIYGCLAAPSEKGYQTINDSPEAIAFSWEVSTTPVAVTGHKPTATLTVDSTKVDPTALAELEDILYGTVGTDPRLPLPDEVIALFAGSLTVATPTRPTFVSSTGVITIPSVTGVRYRRKDTGAIVAAGTVTIGVAGASLVIEAEPENGYIFPDTADDDYSFTRDP